MLQNAYCKIFIQGILILDVNACFDLFRWYLENIYPESQMPLDYFSLGEVSTLQRALIFLWVSWCLVEFVVKNEAEKKNLKTFVADKQKRNCVAYLSPW